MAKKNNVYSNEYVEYLPMFERITGLDYKGKTDDETTKSDVRYSSAEKHNDTKEEPDVVYTNGDEDDSEYSSVDIIPSKGVDENKIHEYLTSERQCVRTLTRRIRGKQPFFIEGKAGWGKTSMIVDIANACGFDVITLYLDKADPEDLGGLPLVNDKGARGMKRTDMTVPDWAYYMITHSDKYKGKYKGREFLLFLDEFNQADSRVMNAMMPIVLRHVIAGRVLDNFFVGAAGNQKDENRKGITPLSKQIPLLSRFGGIIKWDENWDEALDFLENKYKDVENSNKLFNILKEDNLGGLPNYKFFYGPRDLEKFINYLLSLTDDDKKESAWKIKSADILDELKMIIGDTIENEYGGGAEAINNFAEECYNFIMYSNKAKNTDQENATKEWSQSDIEDLGDLLIAGYRVKNKRNSEKPLIYPIVLDEAEEYIKQTAPEGRIRFILTSLEEYLDKRRSVARFKNREEFYAAYPDFDANPSCVLEK